MCSKNTNRQVTISKQYTYRQTNGSKAKDHAVMLVDKWRDEKAHHDPRGGHTHQNLGDNGFPLKLPSATEINRFQQSVPSQSTEYVWVEAKRDKEKQPGVRWGTSLVKLVNLVNPHFSSSSLGHYHKHNHHAATKMQRQQPPALPSSQRSVASSQLQLPTQSAHHCPAGVAQLEVWRQTAEMGPKMSGWIWSQQRHPSIGWMQHVGYLLGRSPRNSLLCTSCWILLLAASNTGDTSSNMW